jgi:hypothetical protein
MYCANLHRFNYRTNPALVLEPPLWSIVPIKFSPLLSSCSLDHANIAAYTCTKTSSQVMRTVLCNADRPVPGPQLPLRLRGIAHSSVEERHQVRSARFRRHTVLHNLAPLAEPTQAAWHKHASLSLSPGNHELPHSCALRNQKLKITQLCRPRASRGWDVRKVQ